MSLYRGNVRGQRPYDIKKGCKVICKKCPNKVDSDCKNILHHLVHVITSYPNGQVTVRQ